MKFIRVTTIIIAVLFIEFKTNAQPVTIKAFPNRYRISYESVSMKNELPIEFLGLGYDLFKLIEPAGKVYLGINSYSAMNGIRGGFFSYGMETGFQQPLLKNSFFTDASVFIGGGGGAGAPDGGGLIIRYALDLEYRFKNIGFRLGYSRFTLPTGDIRSNQFSFGITINNYHLFKHTQKISDTLNKNDLSIAKHRVGFVGTKYSQMKRTMVGKNADLSNVYLIGIQFDRYVNQTLFGTVEANGVVSGGFGGYLAYMAGFGFEFPVYKSISFESRLLIGSAGGGAVHTGGGAFYHYEAGPVVSFFKNYFIKFLIGKTITFGGKLNVVNFDFVLGKDLSIIQINKTKCNSDEFILDKQNIHVSDWAVGVYNRTYFPPKNIVTLKGTTYQTFFNSIGIDFKYYPLNNWVLIGSTAWAYQGDHGAYGEGWIGPAYNIFVSKKTNIELKALVGAGGGGDINVGSGLLFQYGATILYKLDDQWKISANIGKFVPFKGDFTPILFDLGVQLDLNIFQAKN